ncbi:MAG TPA: ABC transporter ATP-binding protein [Candidatus Scatomorpha intestinigallinarum]|uniref:ABC transporter ATP-binding protein n=1 Tax=Candidatus Scatomorpha intestinigallinarum TaxID=2840923 RepID=A0A9D1DLD6_9FIRM|nr:ABC transporter ATP-binding protein [Candidatus Scatomorpha intestinigallinarum]
MKEEKLTGRGKAKLVVRYLRPVAWLFALGLLMSLFSQVFNALIPQIVRVTVDSVLGTEKPQLPAALAGALPIEALRADPAMALVWAAGAVVLFAVLRGFAIFGQRLFLARGSEGFVKGIRDELFSHIQRLPFAWHTAHQTGEMIQRCTSDVEVVRTFVCTQLVEVIRTVILVAVYLYAMFSMNVKLSLVSLAFIPVVALSSGLFYGRIAARFKVADEAEGELTTMVQENLTGVRVVRAFGRESFELGKFNEKNDRFSELWIKLGRVLAVYWASGTLLTCLQVMVILILGVVEAVRGELTLGGFLAFVSYNSTLAWPVRSLGRVLADMSKAGVSMDRVAYILRAEEERELPGAAEAPMDGDIVFSHVSFGYEGQEVLRDVSFTVPAGSTFAILGGTGSGKSTLVHLLDRLYDLGEGQGEITIGGRDIRLIERGYLRRNIGLVLQEPFLFSRTIRENIAAPRPGAAEAEIRRAAAIACVDEAVTEFPDGYDTLVGERGVTLSGGQKQRVAIARMLISGAPVMVFDDSLSAVDSETDAKIRAALRESLGRATVILISHRITTLMQAERILVLENGQVSDIGTHEELISRPGIYREIYDIQMSSDDRRLIEEGGRAHAGI